MRQYKRTTICYIPCTGALRRLFAGGGKMTINVYKKKTPENLDFPGFCKAFESVLAANYLLENWGARRAALRPYWRTV